jgi:hypothetical protein
MALQGHGKNLDNGIRVKYYQGTTDLSEETKSSSFWLVMKRMLLKAKLIYNCPKGVTLYRYSSWYWWLETHVWLTDTDRLGYGDCEL